MDWGPCEGSIHLASREVLPPTTTTTIPNQPFVANDIHCAPLHHKSRMTLGLRLCSEGQVVVLHAGKAYPGGWGGG